MNHLNEKEARFSGRKNKCATVSTAEVKRRTLYRAIKYITQLNTIAEPTNRMKQ